MTSQEDFALLVSLRADLSRQAEYLALRNRIATANHGLVVRIAKRYVASGDRLKDLIQAGAAGLLEALAAFDPGRGKLSTFADRHIRGKVIAELTRGRAVIRVPNPNAAEPATLNALHPLSLDARRDTEHTLYDRTAARQAPVDSVISAGWAESIRACLQALDPAERALLALRFGV